jgi:CubicO group peptidase (beta-lactamase class C family)
VRAPHLSFGFRVAPSSVQSRRSSGFADTAYAPVRDAFEDVLAARDGWSGAVAAYVDGKPVVDLWGGPAYARDSLQSLTCTTKCVSAVTMARLVERGLLDLDARVADYWPEFASGGKQDVTVRLALSHQAGLIAVDGGFTYAECLAHEPAAVKLAAQRPYWPPGEAHGYHGVTLGLMMDELVRRVTGTTLRDYYREEIKRPYYLDVFLGLPESEEPRLVPFAPALAVSREWIALWRAWNTRELPAAAVNAVTDVPSDPKSMLDFASWRSLRASGLPSSGGVGTARGLARLMAAATTGVDGRPPLLSPATVAAVSETQASGRDKVLPTISNYGIVFYTPWRQIPMAGEGSLGHDGTGGSLVYANPRLGLAFGFTTNVAPGYADRATVDLSREIVECIEHSRPAGGREVATSSC